MTASLPKSPLASRTIVGVLVSLLSSLLDRYGHGLSPALQGEVVDLVLQITTIGGAIFAIYGRWRAERPLRLGGAGDVAKGLVLALLLGALTVGGPVACSSKVETQTEQQRVFALASDLIAVQEAAVVVAESPQTPAAVVTALAAADAVAVDAVTAA
ncbi:MAG: hypothetical protein LDL44_19765, partial [Caenispirillum sp.]|nr:hypothetical protein [Caenispirillum sp.]